VRDLEAAGYAPNTICQRIATLASFYRWAVSNGQITSNPVEGARRSRKPAESTASGLSRHELTEWLGSAERRGGSAYPCACLLALNALRVGELCALSVEHLGESNWHHTTTLRASTTKGRKAAVVALAPRTVKALRVTLEDRRSGPLLLNRTAGV
jgi:integrase/recombinase XerD